MPLNKLENFIKNTEGRVLYVNPNDLDSTDGIENQGNSLTKPFKPIQSIGLGTITKDNNLQRGSQSDINTNANITNTSQLC